MFFVKTAYAQCPVCIVTIGGGLFIAKKLGIDDLLVSIWISGLNTAIAFWFASMIKKKIINNPYLWSFLFYITTLIYFWQTKQLNHPRNTFFGIDKILLGTTIGLLTSIVALLIDKLIRKKNKGKVLFYYQKVIIPLLLLSIVTVVFKLLL